MTKVKVNLSSSDGKVQSLEIEGPAAQQLIGKKIGEIIEGTPLGMSGVKLKITGGSNKDGFPMRSDIHGGVRKKVLMDGGVGFKPSADGQRKRKMVHGNTITDDIVQVNLKSIV